jgi:glucosamine--fructose-6-phosphate aminotransferase (isomerizing)
MAEPVARRLAGSASDSAMRTEALEAPACVARQLAADADGMAAAAARLRQPAGSIVTLARGSSDHAAQHFAYLSMQRGGRLVTSLPPSLLTLHGARFDGAPPLALAWSQSGRSPDLVDSVKALRAAGAWTLALVNEPDSPLAAAAASTLALHAAPERSVAATKSFIAQLVLGVRLLAASRDDAALLAALPSLPETLADAATLDWSAAVDAWQPAQQLYVVGRGAALAVAQEMALKLKETCGIQAEAWSGAELMHGPLALVGPGWPVLVLAPRGPAQASLVALAQQLHQRRAAVLLAVAPGTPGCEGLACLPLHSACHADLDAISAVQSFYLMVEALARARGRDPDHPPGLAKVTLTR